VRRAQLTAGTARFAREWNVALLLVAVVAGLLLATHHWIAGAGAIGLGVLAVAARWSATRRHGLGFYGQDKPPR
jgi:hypothetical protein